MKRNKSYLLLAALGSLILMSGCGGSDDGDSSSKGSAPSNISGKTLTVQVESGTPVFTSSGSYTFMSDNGAGNSGTYHIEGFGGVPSNIGTFTYQKTGDNTAVLVETEESGTVVHNVLTFDTATSGRINSDIPSGANPNGGVQTGTFTLN